MEDLKCADLVVTEPESLIKRALVSTLNTWFALDRKHFQKPQLLTRGSLSENSADAYSNDLRSLLQAFPKLEELQNSIDSAQLVSMRTRQLCDQHTPAATKVLSILYCGLEVERTRPISSSFVTVLNSATQDSVVFDFSIQPVVDAKSHEIDCEVLDSQNLEVINDCIALVENVASLLSTDSSRPEKNRETLAFFCIAGNFYVDTRVASIDEYRKNIIPVVLMKNSDSFIVDGTTSFSWRNPRTTIEEEAEEGPLTGASAASDRLLQRVVRGAETVAVVSDPHAWAEIVSLAVKRRSGVTSKQARLRIQQSEIRSFVGSDQLLQQQVDEVPSHPHPHKASFLRAEAEPTVGDMSEDPICAALVAAALRRRSGLTAAGVNAAAPNRSRAGAVGGRRAGRGGRGGRATLPSATVSTAPPSNHEVTILSSKPAGASSETMATVTVATTSGNTDNNTYASSDSDSDSGLSFSAVQLAHKRKRPGAVTANRKTSAALSLLPVLEMDAGTGAAVFTIRDKDDVSNTLTVLPMTALLSDIRISVGKRYGYWRGTVRTHPTSSSSSSGADVQVVGCCRVLLLRDMHSHHPAYMGGARNNSSNNSNSGEMSDNQVRSAYPRIRHRRRTGARSVGRKCSVCDCWNAEFEVHGDKLAEKSPTFYCKLCYQLLHYDSSGRLLYDDYFVFPCRTDQLSS